MSNISESHIGNYDQYYSIGNAAKICNTSVQTLRYYDKIGLVNPTHTDKFTGYRYYSNRDMLYIKIVQDMKQLHFSLEEIRALLKTDQLDELLIQLAGKRQEILNEVERLQQTVRMIDERTAGIHYVQELGQELKELDLLIELKSFPERYLFSDRGQYECGMEPSIAKFTELIRKAETLGLSPGSMMTIYHENILTFDRLSSDLEYAIEMRSAEISNLNLNLSTCRVLPEGDYITALYSGIPNEHSCKQVYSKLIQWLERHDYCECGPSIERYIVDMAQVMKPEEFLVELQLPVCPK